MNKKRTRYGWDFASTVQPCVFLRLHISSPWYALHKLMGDGGMGGKVKLPPATQIGRKVKLPLATPMEDIDYLKSMLHGAIPLAARNDVVLAHFLTMAYEHAIDLLSGKVSVQAETPRKWVDHVQIGRPKITSPLSSERARVGFGVVTGNEIDG